MLTDEAPLHITVSAVPILILPPLFMSYLQRRKLLPMAGLRARAAETGIIAVCLMAFLPPAIATFPQAARIDARKLEPKFHNLKDEDGNVVHTLYYNKGL
jgi:sideroflexin-5